MFKVLGVYLLQPHNASIPIIEFIQQQYSKPLNTFSSSVMGFSNKLIDPRLFKITISKAKIYSFPHYIY